MGSVPLDVASRKKSQQEVGDIEVRELTGLSLKADLVNQPAGCWQQLDNFDLYVAGSVRKIAPVVKYGLGPYGNGAKILNFSNYFAQPNKTNGPVLKVLGVGTDAKIYDLTTGTQWADLSPLVGNTIDDIPFIDEMPIFFVPFNVVGWMASSVHALNDAILKYDAVDGNLYVYYVSAVVGDAKTGLNEPTWVSGNIVDNNVTWTRDSIPNSARFQENGLVITVPGFYPILCVEWQYAPNNNAEAFKVFVQTLGITAPTSPVQLGIVTIAPNLNGYAPLAGRAYSYTWYDPNTLHESSPAPIAGKTKITETDSGNAISTIQGSILTSLPLNTTGKQFQSYQSVYASIPLSQVESALAAGYEQMYLYATRDGGATFSRVTQVFDDQENIISNSDGSVSLANLIALSIAKGWTDYTPLPTPQAAVASVRLYEGGGAVNLAPDPENLGAISWVVKTGSAMQIVPGDAPDGQAAIEQIGTGAGQPNQIIYSIPIKVTAGTHYYFQAYLDATQVTAGTVEWSVIAPDSSVAYLTKVQVNGTAGTVSGTFVKPADGFGTVRLRARSVAATINNDAAAIWADPIFEVGTALGNPANYPTTDSSLVIPAPTVLSQNSPPIAVAQVLFQGSLFLVEKGTFRIWYSNSGDIQSFGATAFLPLDTSCGCPVLELVQCFDRLVAGKQRNLSEITGTSQANFTPAPIDPQHGVKAARSSISIGNALVSLLNDGIALVGLGLRIPAADEISIGFRPEDLIGDPIKPLTDSINPNTLFTPSLYEPCPVVDNTFNNYLFAYQSISGAADFSDSVLMASLTHKGFSKWSRIIPLPFTKIITMKEVQFFAPTTGIPTIGVLASCSDGNIYWLFGGIQDGTLIATATTWALPDVSQAPPDLRDTIKVFREVWIEGNDLPNFRVSWSFDNNTWSSPQAPIFTQQPNGSKGWRVKIGANGRQIFLKFTHAAATSLTPLLSYFKLNYDIMGEASGGNA